MNVDPLSRLRAAVLKRADKRASTGSSGFAEALGSEPRAGGVSGSAPLGPVDSLLALQAVGERPDGSTQARERAEDLLDQLDEIRVGLLVGSIPVAELEKLSAAVQRRRAHVEDPRLAELLDEVDLRARVELAKLGRR
ncbi:MAG: flagellar assembly protein FliX [Tistlia sp.]|uniref:flagellar assembly protein FliX n=1 Tax=Tistlia sp. TaxID=3057121 RepID=UPI0034A345D1